MDKFIDSLKKNRIEFKEARGKIIINPKTIRTPMYKPLEVLIDGSIYNCIFYKVYHNIDIRVAKEFVYLNSCIKYIKKYLKGEL